MERGGQSASSLNAVPGTALPDILVSELKEFKDIDYIIITFFVSSVKIVNSLFHAQPCPQGGGSGIMIKLKSIG